MEIICPICKKKFVYKGGKSHFDRNKNHYCSRKCQNIIHGLSRRKNQTKEYKIWCSAKKRAKLNKIRFNLFPEDIPKVPKYCPILGIELKSNNISSPLDSSPSLDKIFPKKGYVKGNVRIISNRANRIKSDATLKELILILKDARKIYEKI